MKPLAAQEAAIFKPESLTWIVPVSCRDRSQLALSPAKIWQTQVLFVKKAPLLSFYWSQLQFSRRPSSSCNWIRVKKKKAPTSGVLWGPNWVKPWADLTVCSFFPWKQCTQCSGGRELLVFTVGTANPASPFSCSGCGLQINPYSGTETLDLCH